MASLLRFSADSSLGVKGSAAPLGVPLVWAESVVVIGVNDGVFAAGEGDAAEGIAVAKSAVEQDDKDERLGQPVRNVNGEVDNGSLV
ncbi:MAG: hypothetical protein ACYS21_07270 [Planctomycetota bacterium]